jgi:hypothetical protein
MQRWPNRFVAGLCLMAGFAVAAPEAQDPGARSAQRRTQGAEARGAEADHERRAPCR